MSKGLIFFFCASAILLFTIINLSVGPIVTNTFGGDWGTENCELDKDNYDIAKKGGDSGDHLKYNAEWDLNECQRKKGMHDMEYTSFIFNAVIGFVCGLLGILHLFDVKKEFISKTGIIGLVCGIVGFIFSFVYVILNGLVFTTFDTKIAKRDENGVFAERVGGASSNTFKCLFFDSADNVHSVYATISDLNKKQYNYDKDLYKTISSVSSSCKFYSSSQKVEDCSTSETQAFSISGCDYLYIYPTTYFTYKDRFDRFLTTLLLSLFVCIANIGLSIFGFLLYKTPSEF